MGKIVHARLDGGSRRIIERLRRRTGWNDSQIIRMGLRALANMTLQPTRKRIVGVGRFESGIPDLGSSEKYLAGFGRL